MGNKVEICLIERFHQIQELVWDMKKPDTVHPDTISDCQQNSQGCIFDEVRGVADRQLCSAYWGCAVCWDLQTWSSHLKYHASPVEVHSRATNMLYVFLQKKTLRLRVNTPVPLTTTLEFLGRDKNAWRVDSRGGGKKLQYYCFNRNSRSFSSSLRMSCADATVPFLRFVEVQLCNLDRFFCIFLACF